MNESSSNPPDTRDRNPDGLRCTYCGIDNLRNSNFCRGCGAPIAAIDLKIDRGGTRATRIPDHLTERILRARAELQDARKLVTVMFADIRGSFEMIEGQDPDDVGEVLNELIDLMADGVHRFDGIIAQVLGDGIMALFGAPLADEDHAVKAAFAALEIHALVDKFNSRTRRLSAFDPRVRIGLHSGEVIIGAVRNDLSFDYRATGVTTHMAARMEQIAAPGETRMTAEAVRLAEGLIEVESLGMTTIKGVSEPVEIFNLVGKSARTRFEAHAMRGLSPFVGRAADLDLLYRAHTSAARGDFRVVSISGNAGIGKSRLCMELIDRHAKGKQPVLTASAFNYGWAPYAVLASLMRSFLGISAGQAVDSVYAAIETKTAELALHADCRSAFENVLNIEIRDPSWSDLDPLQLRYRTFSALRKWLAAMSAERPLTIFLDDLHWFDNESLAFLESVIAAPPGNELLLLLTHRPEFSNPWTDDPSFRFVALESLDDEKTRELIECLIGSSPALEEIRTKLAGWTLGNPFFIEETVRSLEESGVLIGETGRYELSVPDPQIELAPTIESVVAARIDRLDPPLQHYLRAVAAIGEETPASDVLAVLEIDENSFRAQTEQLQELGLIRTPPQGNPTNLVFKHAIVREVAYRSLTRSQRRSLHERILHVLESIYSERLAEKIDHLADHAFAAELWDQAVQYYMVSCRRAAARSANVEAVRALDRGLQALEHLPSTDEKTQVGVDIRLRGLASLLSLGDKERMFRLLREAEYMSRSIGDEIRLGAVNSQLATALWVDGKHERALETAESALDLARKHGKFGLEKAALSNIACVHHAHANFDEVIRIHKGLITDFSGEYERKRFGWPGYPSVFCRTFLGSSLTFIGEFAEALEVFHQGMAIADEVKHPYSQTIVREELAYCLIWLGDFDKALSFLEDALAICKRYDITTMYPAICGRLAIPLVRKGRADDAIEITADALDRKTYRRAGRYTLNYLLTGLATAYLAKDEPDLALETARQAEEMTGASGEAAHQACTLALVGEILHRTERYDEAIGVFCKARDMADRSHMHPLKAQSQYGLARTFAASSREDEARAELESAIAIFDEVGLPERRRQAGDLLQRI